MTAMLVVLLVAMLPLAACGGGGLKGAPGKDGEYTVKPGSISYDGDRYRLLWADANGQYKELSGSGLKMVQDERTFLERKNGDVALHLQQNEPIQVLGRDDRGDYSSPWFPFLAGAVIGNVLSGPSYHYPPTDTFSRGDQLNGSVVTEKPSPPKYAGLPPNPNAVSGQNQGTGGGNAATNKAGGGGVSGQSQSTGGASVSGQAQGTGGGSAATNKGGFRSGPSSYGSSGNSSSGVKVGSGGSGSKPGSGSGGKSAPKAPSGGGSRGGGGRSGGK
jgi:hypothetical protein